MSNIDADKVRGIIEGYANAWATNDKDGLLALFARDAVWIDPVGTPPNEGHEGIGAFWDQARSGGTKLTPVVHRIIVCANEGIMLFRMEVRNPDGSGMDLEVCDHFTINDDGKIQLAKAFWDESSVSLVTP